MINKLFGKFGKNKKAAGPEGSRIYAIGDIHGCRRELDSLLEKIFDEDTGSAELRLVFLGDYVDRGPNSAGVLDRLIALKAERPNTIFLKGNHELAMLNFIASPEDMPEWLDWGGEDTIKSYGVSDVLGRAVLEIGLELREKMPASHIRFLADLPLHFTAGDYLFVHAGLRPGVALEAQVESDLLWIRQEFHQAPASTRPKQTIIHGHHPIKKPTDYGWRVNVDSGACWSGVLSAVVIEGETRRFLTS